MNDTQTIVLLTSRCNQKCIFCSGSDRKRDPDHSIPELIRNEKNSICFEGGEPTLSKKLLNYVRSAKRNEIMDIILITNGVMLSYIEYCKKLIDAGVTLFSISFPHSERKQSDNITSLKGSYEKRMEGIQNLIRLGHADKIRLTYVINSTNINDITHFAELVVNHFPNILYIEFNLIKNLGAVKNNKALIPRLTDIRQSLLTALELCKKKNINVILDGFPLCQIPGFEHKNIDTQFLLKNKDNPFIKEKIKPAVCTDCTLFSICSGIRKDYLEIHGDKELHPSLIDPKFIRFNSDQN